MGKKLLLCMATVALGSAAAASYTLTLYEPLTVDGKVLKEGAYKLEVRDHSAVISQGKTTVEAEVKSEVGEKKYSTTSVKYIVNDGKNNIQEIRLGGTKTKLVFDSSKPASGGM